MSIATLGSWLVVVAAGASPPEVDARWWINNPPFRLHDDRKVVLFFFDCRDFKSDAAVRRLNELCARRDVVVIGLTPDRHRAAEAFAKRNRVRFTIGAGSRSARVFRVRERPALLWIERRGADPAPIDVDELHRHLPPAPDAASQPVDASSLDEETLRRRRSETLALDDLDAEALEDVIDSDDPRERRRAAVEKLWNVLGSTRPQEFIEFAESQLQAEPDPWIRGQLRYFLGRARGNPEPKWTQSASNAALLDYRKNRDAPEWKVVRDFEAEAPARTPSAALDEYRRRATSDPKDLMIRRLAVQRLGTAPQDEAARIAARAALLEILQSETDRSIRLTAVGSLAATCKAPDPEAAKLLDSLAEREPDVLNVRPTMERAAQYLRTGDREPDAGAEDPPTP